MLQHRISALFFISCLVLFSVGAILTLPPHTDKWEVYAPSMEVIARGETSANLEKQIEDKLSYKDMATNLWGSLRYKFFNMGTSGVIVGKDGWLFTKEEFETHDLFAETTKVRSTLIRSYVSILKRHGIIPIIAWIPAKTRNHSDKLANHHPPILHQSIKAPRNLPLIDGNYIFNDLSHPAFMRTDTHWSSEGAKAMALTIRDYIALYHPDLKLTEKQFTTKIADESNQLYRGDLLEFIPTIEAVKPKGEPIIRYVTEASSAAASDNLFGDEMIDVVLIGTSYSAQKDWHFEGFLKQFLQTDVLNLADEGQGPFAPMEKFVENLPNQEHKPKLVIWEFPERYLGRKFENEESE